MLTEGLLEEVGVVAENLVVLNEFKRFSVVRVCLVQEHVETNGSQSEVGNCDLLAGNILATIGGNSLLNCGDPDWEHLEPCCLMDGLLLLMLLEVELEVCVEVILDGIDGGVNLPCGLGLLGVVSVLAAEESENGPGLDVLLTVFSL